jgi:hypothetical protein
MKLMIINVVLLLFSINSQAQQQTDQYQYNIDLLHII